MSASARRALERSAPALLALALYTCLSVAIFGRAVVGNPGHVVEGFGQLPRFYGRDQSNFVWFLAWGARALTHGLNPFVTNALFVPGGFNLAWATSVMGPALLMAPVTVAFSPIISFNVLALAAPATAAWTAFLLCRHLVRRWAAAFAGGLLFGFGTYESVEMVNHLHLALIAMLPLVPLIVLRRRDGLTSRRGFALQLGAVLALQFWTSTEVFASLVVFAALALVLAGLLGGRGEWGRLEEVARDGLGALAVTGVLVAPYLYYAIANANPISNITGAAAGADLANYVIPTRVTWLHGATRLAAKLRENLTEQTAYFGAPLLLLLAAAAVLFRRRRGPRYVLVFTGLVLVASLGSELYLDGSVTHFPLPWAVPGQLPLLRFAITARFVVYAWLAVALLLSWWLVERRPAVLRWGVAGVVLASVAPNVTGIPWGTPVDSPPLLRGASLTRYVPSGSTVLALPFGIAGNSMYWQVEADFRFRLAGGYVSVSLPHAYQPRRRFLLELEGALPVRGDARREMCDFIRFSGATTILLRTRTPGPWPSLLDPLGVRPARAGGFLIYRVKPC